MERFLWLGNYPILQLQAKAALLSFAKTTQAVLCGLLVLWARYFLRHTYRLFIIL